MAAVRQRVDVAVRRDPAPRVHFPGQRERHLPGLTGFHRHFLPRHAPLKTTAGMQHIVPSRHGDPHLAIAGVNDTRPCRHRVLRTSQQGLQAAIRAGQREPARHRSPRTRLRDHDLHPRLTQKRLHRSVIEHHRPDLDVIEAWRRFDEQHVFAFDQSPRWQGKQRLHRRLGRGELTQFFAVQFHRPAQLHLALPDPQRVLGGVRHGLKSQLKVLAIHRAIFELLPLIRARFAEMQAA